MMGRVSISVCGAVFLALAATSARSLPARAFERAEFFAACAGRLSALAVHQDGFGEGNAAATQEMAEMFEMLLDATLPGAIADGVPADEPVKWRNRGWADMAVLLAEAHFSFDTVSADASALALNRNIAECLSAVLPTGAAVGHVMRNNSPTR